MPFTKENAAQIGRLGGQAGGVVTSERKTLANREKLRKARAEGKMGGRPRTTSTCTCGQFPHKSTCRVYLAEKQRESRARRGLHQLVRP